MSATPALHWLPAIDDWRPRLAAFRAAPSWDEAMALAGSRLDFVRTNALDASVLQAFAEPPAGLATRPVRLAILGSSTLAHLHAGIRLAALRRGIHLTTYENEYGQYLQELMEPESGLHRFRPTAILLALDAHHLAAGVNGSMSAAGADAALAEIEGRITQCWQLAREAFACPIIHQTALPVWPAAAGQQRASPRRLARATSSPG